MYDNTLYVDISIQNPSPVKIDVLNASNSIDISVSSSGHGLPEYEGIYEVTPRKIEQTLPTKNRSLNKDVTVYAIPYAETTNPAGGTTVVIGLEE